MKIIIFGLGNFGSSLSNILTDLGHEVPGVDSDLPKVETHRSKITNTISLDATDAFALSTLPLREADLVVVAIGDYFGGAVMSTGLLKQKKVKRGSSPDPLPLCMSRYLQRWELTKSCIPSLRQQNSWHAGSPHQA